MEMRQRRILWCLGSVGRACRIGPLQRKEADVCLFIQHSAYLPIHMHILLHSTESSRISLRELCHLFRSDVNHANEDLLPVKELLLLKGMPMKSSAPVMLGSSLFREGG